MRKLYTGPFGPMARTVWVQIAKKRIAEGKGESFLFILPTSELLKNVRDQLLREMGGISEIRLMAFDDIAQAVVEYADPYAKMLTNYELRRFYDRFLEDEIRAQSWSAIGDQSLQDEVRQTIIRSISEMKRSGMTVEQAKRVASSSESNPKHRALAQLLIRSDAELEKLSEENGYTCLTYEARLERASRYLSGETPTIPPWLRQVDTIWVDHFTDFFPLQFQLLRSLIELKSVKRTGIYIPYERECYEEPVSRLFPERSARRRGGLAHHMEQTLARFRNELGFAERNFSDENYSQIQKEIASDWNALPLETNEEPPRPELWRLPKRVFAAVDVPASDDALPPVAMIPCASERKEAEMAAKLIKQRLLSDDALKPSDFAIVVRDREQAANELLAVFAKERLPLRLRFERKVDELPLFQQLIALLQLKSSNWSRDCLLKIADGAYFVWRHPPRSSFVRWAKERGVREGERAWHEALRRHRESLEQQRWQRVDDDEEQDKEKLERKMEEQRERLQQYADWLNELREWTAFIQDENTMEGHLAGFEQFLDNWNLPRLLASFAKEKEEYGLDSFKRDLACARIIRNSLRQLRISAEKMGEMGRRLRFRQFLMEWEEQWREETILMDVGDDEGVYCLEPTAARGLSFAHVFVLGCNDGVFPLKHREQWLLDDAERLLLQENGTLIASRYRRDMEKMFFIMAMAAARESLTLTFVSPKTNESMLPSAFLEAILKKLPERWLDREAEKWAEALSKKAYAEDPTLVSSPEEYGLWLMSRSGERSDADGAHLLRSEWLPDEFPSILQGAWIERKRRFGPFSEWDGYLQDERAVQAIAAMFDPNATPFSVSQINEYMSSPLTFFFRRVLKAEPLAELEEELSPIDRGLIQHEALRAFYERHRGESLSLERLETLREELMNLAREEAKRFAEGTIYERSTLFQVETEFLARGLGDWLEIELTSRQKADPRLTPEYFELSFGMDRSLGPSDPASTEDFIEIPLENERLRLKGKIDRIDVDPEGHFVIFDYKSSLSRYKNYLRLDDDTLTFQMPIYLRATEQWLRSKGARDPKMIGGAFYSVGASDCGQKRGLWDEDRKTLLGLSGNTKSYPIEEKIAEDLRQVERGLRRLREGRFYLGPEHRINRHYADNALYRYDPIAARRKEEGGDDGQ